MKIIHQRFSVAPMLGYTDKYCRYFYSLFTKYINLYTGMIHISSFLNRYKNNKLSFNLINNYNVGIQFSGNDTKKLYLSSKIAKKLNFTEINFNIGCPSLKAKYGTYGFYLSNNLDKVIDCINSIIDGYPEAIFSLKLRINENYCYNDFLNFIGNIYYFTKCKIFIIHARSILKNNYSTKLNLIKPNLNYNIVYRIKKDLPDLHIVINGNIKNIYEIDFHLKYVDGVMLGRYLYKNPILLLDINDYIVNKNIINENKLFLDNKLNYKIKNILFIIYEYIKNKINLSNFNPIYILKHVLNIFYKNYNASYLRNKIIKSSNLFNKFNSYIDFEDFLFK